MENEVEMDNCLVGNYLIVGIVYASLKKKTRNSVFFQNYAFSLQKERA